MKEWIRPRTRASLSPRTAPEPFKGPHIKPMPKRKARELAKGYTSEVDTVTERDWQEQLQEFNDANIYQTWSYAEVSWGVKNTSHLVLKKDGSIVALAQVRVLKLPFVNIGIAYVRWGPMWRARPKPMKMYSVRRSVRSVTSSHANAA